MQLKQLLLPFFLLNLWSLDFANAAQSQWHANRNNGAQSRLIASFYKKDGEQKLIAAVHFKISSGWKIYGNDSGGIGLPPAFDFSKSQNYLSHNIFWPQSAQGEERIGKEVLKYSYYSDEVIIPILITPKETKEPVELTLNLDYGLCKEICIPVNETFTLKVPLENDIQSLREIEKFYDQKLVENNLPNLDLEKEKGNSRTPTQKLFYAIFLALIGGAILNIMPCVLPVLSIKLISVIKHSGATISRIRFAFISTLCGILFCFIILALIAGTIKLTGNSLGWGFQFQNPYFLILLAIILMFFIANLLGIFEITFDEFFANFLNKKITEQENKKHIFIPNFLSGILAVLLATPCSAPFLGAAISFALVENFLTIFTIFIFIGIGFSVPYLILIFSPKLVYLLPKPGAWMLKTKQVMAGFLAATVVWLIYILSDNIGTFSALFTSILLVGLLVCFKIKSVLCKYFSLAVIISFIFALPSDMVTRKKADDDLWQKFDEATIHEEVSKGNVVVIDITADWCLTCKFNKVRVLQNPEIMKKLKSGNTIALRGDITKPDTKIMEFLHKHNRFAIPFNAVYGPSAKDGLLASEFLTKEELVELIDRAR